MVPLAAALAMNTIIAAISSGVSNLPSSDDGRAVAIPVLEPWRGRASSRSRRRGEEGLAEAGAIRLILSLASALPSVGVEAYWISYSMR